MTGARTQYLTRCAGNPVKTAGAGFTPWDSTSCSESTQLRRLVSAFVGVMCTARTKIAAVSLHCLIREDLPTIYVENTQTPHNSSTFIRTIIVATRGGGQSIQNQAEDTFGFIQQAKLTTRWNMNLGSSPCFAQRIEIAFCRQHQAVCAYRLTINVEVSE